MAGIDRCAFMAKKSFLSLQNPLSTRPSGQLPTRPAIVIGRCPEAPECRRQNQFAATAVSCLLVLHQASSCP